MDDRIEAVALLPCPFCGSAVATSRWEAGNFGDEEAGVICGSCGATHGEYVGYKPSDEEVSEAIGRRVAAWNRRTLVAAQKGEA